MAGAEAAWQAAIMGVKVTIHEMRPDVKTFAHQTGELAEMVCSNSFRSDDDEQNAVGLLHWEMRTAHGIIINNADKYSLPAGGALAVDRDLFAQGVTKQLREHTNISIKYSEIEEIPESGNWIIATGPLTSSKLAASIATSSGQDSLAFFDAIAPIIYLDTVDMEKTWFQSRYDKGETEENKKAYLNCPMDKKTYEKFIDNLLALKEEISKEICWQIGRPISQCGNELRGFEERSRHMVDIAKTSLENIPARKNDEFDNYIYKSPLGVIFVMAPWNYPIITATNTIVPALLAGNTLLLKHSSQTPMCAELLSKAFENTGLPEGVFQFVHTNHESCEKIISDPRISHVVFTGSVRGGQEIKKYIGTRFINVGLELGGKDPAYVRSDADVNHAVENLVDGALSVSYTHLTLPTNREV